MKISKNGIDLVKHYETFMSKPYLCPAHVATIGYGTTVYENGKKVSLRDHAITEADACILLQHDLDQFEADVARLVKVPLAQGQFDALVSFSYNVGSPSLAKSTLLKYLNGNVMATNPNWKRVVNIEFNKWIYAKGRVLGGLIARRQSEAWLFCDGQLKYFTSKK